MGWLVAFLMLLEALSPILVIVALWVMLTRFHRYVYERGAVVRTYRRWKKKGGPAPVPLFPKHAKWWDELVEIDRKRAARSLLLRRLWRRIRHGVRKPVNSGLGEHWQEIYRSGRVSVERPAK